MMAQIIPVIRIAYRSFMILAENILRNKVSFDKTIVTRFVLVVVITPSRSCIDNQYSSKKLNALSLISLYLVAATVSH
jgi:hypothetical protein